MGVHEKQTARPPAPGPTSTGEKERPAEQGETSSRPTIVPPFDVGKFAREKMNEEEGSPFDRPTVPPPLAAAPAHDEDLDEDLDAEPVAVTIDVDEPRAGVTEAASSTSEEEETAELVVQLGSMDGVPIMVVDPAEAYKVIDARGAFLLAQIDGVSTMETILDICGMRRLDALRLLVSFRRRGLLVVT